MTRFMDWLKPKIKRLGDWRSLYISRRDIARLTQELRQANQILSDAVRRNQPKGR